MKSYTGMLCVAAICALLALPCTHGANKAAIDWELFVSDDIRSACDSQVAKYSGSPDSIEIGQVIGLRLKSTKFVRVHGQSYIVVLVGCLGTGEIIFLDSTDQTTVRMRKRFRMPDHGASLNALRDLNNDGSPELQIGLVGGNRGPHLYFLSVFPDSLSFILTPEDDYDFYAMSGYVITDLDKDRIFEVRINGYVPKGKRESFTVYKFSGQKAVVVQRVER